MGKLLRVKRSDRIECASAETIEAAGLLPPHVEPGDVILGLAEIRWSRWLVSKYKQETGLDYLFAIPQNFNGAAFLIPMQDVQELPDPTDMLTIIAILQ